MFDIVCKVFDVIIRVFNGCVLTVAVTTLAESPNSLCDKEQELLLLEKFTIDGVSSHSSLSRRFSMHEPITSSAFSSSLIEASRSTKSTSSSGLDFSKSTTDSSILESSCSLPSWSEQSIFSTHTSELQKLPEATASGSSKKFSARLCESLDAASPRIASQTFSELEEISTT